MDHFEKKYNELRSAFDMNKRALDDVTIIMEELQKEIDIDNIKDVLRHAIISHKHAVSSIGLKCGYSE